MLLRRSFFWRSRAVKGVPACPTLSFLLSPHQHHHQLCYRVCHLARYHGGGLSCTAGRKATKRACETPWLCSVCASMTLCQWADVWVQDKAAVLRAKSESYVHSHLCTIKCVSWLTSASSAIYFLVLGIALFGLFILSLMFKCCICICYMHRWWF